MPSVHVIITTISQAGMGRDHSESLNLGEFGVLDPEVYTIDLISLADIIQVRVGILGIPTAGTDGTTGIYRGGPYRRNNSVRLPTARPQKQLR